MPRDLLAEGAIATKQTGPRDLVAETVAQAPAKTGDLFMRAPGGSLDAAKTLITGASALPIGGLMGIRALLTGGSAQEATTAIRQTQDLLTLEPSTEEGKQLLGQIQGFFGPLSDLFARSEAYLGDETFKRTRSPALAAAATTIPTAATEALGLAAVKVLPAAVKMAKKRRLNGDIVSETGKAAPTIPQLKDAARAVYKEIDELGAVVNPSEYGKLLKDVRSIFDEFGDPDLTRPAAVALDRFERLEGMQVPLSEIEKLRRKAKIAADSQDPTTAMIGSKYIDAVDNFLNKDGNVMLEFADGTDFKYSPVNVGAQYNVARDLWGRARRAELMEEAFEKSRNAAGGFEAGLKTQLRALLNNKRRSRLFNKEELDAIRLVVRGDKKANVAQLLGKFDVLGKSPGLMGTIGLGAGIAAAGPWAFALPGVGYVSKSLGYRLIRNRAKMADQVIRAGRDAKKITEAYIKNTPKHLRSPKELSQLLMRQDVDFSQVPATPFNDAVKAHVAGRYKMGSTETAATGRLGSAEQKNIFETGVIEDINDLSDFGKLKDFDVIAEGPQGVKLGAIKLFDDTTPDTMPAEIRYRGNAYRKKHSIDPEDMDVPYQTLQEVWEDIDPNVRFQTEDLYGVYDNEVVRRLGAVTDIIDTPVWPDEITVGNVLYERP